MIRNKYNASMTAALSFAVIVCAVTPVLVANGGNLYLVGDFMTQQIPFMHECRRMLLSKTPFWSANTFFGANFWGSYSFYVYPSPFFWPLLLVPERFMGMGIAVMFILKHVTAALTSYLYLKKQTKLPYLAVVGAMLYAFSSFSLDSTYYYHFLDVIAFFPLIPYFTDCVLEKKHMVLLSLSAFLCAVTNYYFFVGTSIFFLIYIFFKVRFSDKYDIKDAVRCVVFYALGALASAVVLLPSALTLLETSKATDSFSKILLSSLTTVPQIIKILKGLVLPSEGILGSGTGFVFASYCSNAAFLPFFGAVFLTASLQKKASTWDSKLIRFLLILTLVPFGNGLFSLMTNLNYTRWWYALVLITVTVSIKVVEDFYNNRAEAYSRYKSAAKVVCKVAVSVTVPLAAFKALCAYVLSGFIESHFPQALKKYLDSSSLTKAFTLDDLRYLLTLLILTALTYLPLHLAMKKQWIYNAGKTVTAVALICCASYCLYMCNECNWFAGKNSETVNELSVAAQSEAVSSSSRVQFKKKLANYGLVVNQPSITTFNSFKSHSTSEFCRIVGYEVGSMPTTKSYFSTPAIQTVFNIRNIENLDSTVIDAPYYAGFGYEYKYFVLDNGYEFTKDKKENNKRIELMTKACIIDSNTAIELSDIIAPLGNQSFDWKEAAARDKTTACQEFQITSEGFSAVSQGGGDRLLYFSIPHDNGWQARVNGEEVEIYTINGGMMGIKVPGGRAEIQFKFVPPGLKLGAAVSAASFAIIFAYAVYESAKRRKKK